MQDWTDEEIKILLENIKLPNKKINELYLSHRTPQAIKSKIRQLGKTKEIRYKWTKEEKDLLFSNLNKTMPELILMFGGKFNKNSITSQLFKKGVTCKNSRTDLWTEEEYNIIRDNYMYGSKRLMALLPNKSLNAIHMRSSSIGINIPFILDWSYEEIELLKSLCDGNKTYEDLTSYFPDKSRLQISGKCGKLGLNNLIKLKIDYWSEEEIQYLKENYCNLSIEELSNNLNRNPSGIITKASNLKLTNNTAHPWSQDEIDLLHKLHKDKIDRCTVFEVFNYRTYPSVKGMITKYKLRFNHNYIADDGISECDSLEEKKVFNYMFNNYDCDIQKYFRTNSDYKFEIETEKYIPDFIINYFNNIKLDKPLIMEYYGYNIENNDYYVFAKYKEKMKRKNIHYKTRNDIYFIDLYPEDLKNNCEGISNKLNQFLNNNIKAGGLSA